MQAKKTATECFDTSNKEQWVC